MRRKRTTGSTVMMISVSCIILIWSGIANARYVIGTDTSTVTSTAYASNGTWSNWESCSDYRANSAPRGFNFYTIAVAYFSKLTMSCRTISEGGSFGEDYTATDTLIKTGYSASNDAARTDSNDYLPIGLELMTDTLIGISTSFTVLQKKAEDIVGGTNEYCGGDNYSFCRAEEMSGNVPAGSWASDFLVCNAGEVMTGMRVKTANPIWPWTGKTITRVQIECAELTDE